MMTKTHPTTKAIERHRREYNGKFPAFSSVGSYTIIYLAADGGTLCAPCVNGEEGSEVGSDDAVYDDGTSDPQWTVIDAGPYWEGPVIHCDHCNAEIESSYGEVE